METTAMTRFITVMAAILAWGFSTSMPALAAGTLPHAKNFKADSQLAAAKKIPILVLFTTPGCHFCHEVKSVYLEPMLSDPLYKNKVIMREVEVGSQNSLTLFNGDRSTEGAFATGNKVFMVPTIKLFNAQGTEVTEPIVGLLTPDYYFGYIDSAITEGIQKMRGK